MGRFFPVLASLLAMYNSVSSAEYTGKKDGGGPRGGYMGKKGKGHGYNETSSLGWVVNDCAAKLGLRPSSGIKECITWSTGLEHESLVVHGGDDQVGEYVVNVGTLAIQMARYGRAFGLDHDTQSIAVYLHNTGVEFSGRECAGINEINFKAMAESVSITHEHLDFDSAFCQIATLDSKILDVLSSSPGEVSISKEFGTIHHPRSGMSSNLGLYTRSGGKIHKCSPCDGCRLKDYTGSYHLSISLPHDSDGWVAYDETILTRSGSCSSTYGGYKNKNDPGETPLDTWVEAHSNLANMIQWVEPLILAVFGSPDSESVCDNGKFVEGSYRTMNSGWGVPGTTDVRTFGETGTGRYSGEGFDWMLNVAPESCLGVFGCVEQGMGSDIRTKSPPSECDVSNNENTLMGVGHGFELRFLDNFPLEHLKDVYRLIALLSEASRVHTAKSYIYGDEGWEYSAQQAILEGWNSILSPDYVSSLELVLDVDLSALDGSVQAYEVLKEVYFQLSLKHANGFWTGLLLHDKEMSPMGNPNREGWEIGARLAGITPEFIKDTFGLSEDSSATVYIEDIEGCNCFDDIEDLVYLAESFGMVDTIESNHDGSVKGVTFSLGDTSPQVLTCSS